MSGGYFDGYGSMLILVHELGHFVDYENNRLGGDYMEREVSADDFVKRHWSFEKASGHARNNIEDHYIQHKRRLR